MYPDGFQTWVDVERLAEGLEGAARPGHFRGVATVCLKLFSIVRPHRAYFGQKDAQQAALVERMAHDLDLEVEIRLVATARDEDGLALSSRNAYLSAGEREAARALPRALEAGAAAHRGGSDAAAAAREALAAEPRLEPDYVEVARLNGRVYLLAAARAGRTRLIDNVVLEGVVE
jgi:pantoate--beta-alanine ligase